MSRYIRNLLVAIAVAFGLLGASAPAVNAVPDAPSIAQAAVAERSVEDCKQLIGAEVNRDKPAVVLVHGLLSKKAAWGDPDKPSSMFATVKKATRGYVEAFDYERTNKMWVDQPNNGVRLAERVACLAKLTSRDVILVGHSMGGLMSRFVANTTTKDGHKVGDDIGLLITLGTPNIGSGWANYVLDNPILGFVADALCHPVEGKVSDNPLLSPCALNGLANNSENINKLGWMPEHVAVQAVAGDVSIKTPLFDKTIVDTDSDMVVSKKSALKGMAHDELGGGQTTIACSAQIRDLAEALTINKPITRYKMPDCWHSALTGHTESKKVVTASIKEYLAATAGKTLTASGLNLKVPQHWTKGKVMVGEPGNGLTGVRTTGVCYQSGYGSCDGFEIRGPGALLQGAGPGYFFNGDSYWSFSGGPDPCPGSNTGRAVSNTDRKKGPVTTTVGGASAEYSEWLVSCADPSGKNQSSYTQRTWWVPSHQVVVVDYNQTAGLWNILRDASWSTSGAPFNELAGSWQALGISASISGGHGILSWDEPGNTTTHIVDFRLHREGSKTYGLVLNGDSGPNDGYGDLSYETGEKVPVDLMDISPGGVSHGAISIGEPGEQILLCSSSKDPQGCGGF